MYYVTKLKKLTLVPADDKGEALIEALWQDKFGNTS